MKFMTWRLWVGVARAALTTAAATALTWAWTGSIAVHAAGPGVRHSFIAFGGDTRIVAEDGTVEWRHPEGTRDGWVLPNGNVLLTLSRSDRHKGGAVHEVTRSGEVVFHWEGTQEEVNTCQRIGPDRIMAVEAGPRPRIVVLDGKGSVVLERALSCQSTNHHMESRMTRSLANGRFIVPQLLDKVVREYGPDGKVTWEYRTPETPPECWPFTAIRTSNGRTLVTLTHGNRVVEVDRKGQVTWSLDNADLPGPWLKDPCGAQRLANGNVVITSYGAGDQKVKLLEVDRRKRVVWTHEEARPGGIHHFQVLTTNGRKEPWPALR